MDDTDRARLARFRTERADKLKLIEAMARDPGTRVEDVTKEGKPYDATESRLAQYRQDVSRLDGLIAALEREADE